MQSMELLQLLKAAEESNICNLAELIFEGHRRQCIYLGLN